CPGAVTIHLLSDNSTPDAACVNAYVRVRTWNFTDACNNPSANFTQTITVHDTTAPVVSTAAGSLDATLECSDASGLSAALAQAPSATDSCPGAVTIHLLSDNSTPD